MITLVQSFKPPSNNNINNTLNINSHIANKLTPKFHMNYSSLEQVLFEKLHNIELSCSIFKVTTLFQFDPTKSTLNTLLEYIQELDENIIFRISYKSINIEQVISSAYHHQSNGQVEACIKFIKCTFKKCADSGRDINMALLQIHMTPLG